MLKYNRKLAFATLLGIAVMSVTIDTEQTNAYTSSVNDIAIITMSDEEVNTLEDMRTNITTNLVEDTEVDLTELEDISITGLGITTEIEEVETQSERKERKEAEAKAKAEAEAAAQTASYTTSSGGLTKSKGVVYYNGHRETYYSQRVLPGTGLNIPGRHVAEDGTIRDGDGYIVLASDLSYAARGTIIQTSLGTGKVYDTGCAYGTIDIYTDW